MSQPPDNATPTSICADCQSFNWCDVTLSDLGTCQNAASDHFAHAIDADHPVCERVTWREARP